MSLPSREKKGKDKVEANKIKEVLRKQSQIKVHDIS